MIEILSQRAETLLKDPQFRLQQKKDSMRSFKGVLLHCWVDLEVENGTVKKMSYYGDVPSVFIVLLESLGMIIKGKTLTHFESVSLRECEAFLRDRNSQPALSKISHELETDYNQFCRWLRLWPTTAFQEEFHFDSRVTIFKQLSLVEKIKFIKAFFRSNEVLDLYKGFSSPELIDVVDLDIFVDVPYETEEERELLHHLQDLAVETFQEPEFNLIPESL